MTDADRRINDSERTALLPERHGRPVPDRFWVTEDWEPDDITPAEDDSAGEIISLSNLAFIRAAVRRKVGLLCALSVVGLLLGLGVLVKFPATYQATTTVVLGSALGTNSGSGIMNDQAFAQSLPVAQEALNILGSHESAATFAGAYTATVVSNQVLQITAGARSSEVAVREANAVAAALLKFQKQLLITQERQVGASLQQQVTALQGALAGLRKQIDQLSGHSLSPTQQTQLTTLQAERTQDEGQLTLLRQSANSSVVSTEQATATQLKTSAILSYATPILQHRRKRFVEYLGAGFLGGLVLALGIIIIGALVSDRLRRRDDVARALGFPVRLSVGAIRPGRLQPGAASKPRDGSVRRILAHLRGRTAAGSPGGPATLAVVPADDARTPAVCLVNLAASCVDRGLRVVVADLCDGTPAGRLLGVSEPGVHRVSIESSYLAVAIPDRADPLPAGPLRPGAAESVATACAGADLLLTLAALDPALGGEHLASWASSAVAMVTAGRSSAARIYAVGEMMRLADMPEVSAVLIGADKNDESIGVPTAAVPQAETVSAVPGAKSFLSRINSAR